MFQIIKLIQGGSYDLSMAYARVFLLRHGFAS